MANSTSIVVAIGAMSYGNAVVFNGQSPVQAIPVIIGTGIAAGMLGLLEQVSPQLAVGIASIALVTMALIPPKSGNSLVTNLLNATSKKT